MVLALNCGSSTLKARVLAVEPARPAAAPRRVAQTRVERIGSRAALAFEAGEGAALAEEAPVPDHGAAVDRAVGWLAAQGLAIDAVGHRVVHGGAAFVQPTLIDDAVVREIEALEALAPLHNRPSLAGIRAARARLPGVPMVAVFDTAFHATLPEHACRYAIPHELALKHGLRRFGFHGTSYRAVLARYCALTGTPPDRATVVALHLGHGCSAAAIRDGRSVETSMGLTPLEGLVMGTRSGDLDPALVGHLARAERVPVEEVERWLNERSGLRGLSGRSGDMREVLAASAAGDPRARLALEVFCHRARKYVGAYLAVLGGADALLFTGGIAEHTPEVRARIAAGLEWAGLVLDPARNQAAVGREARLSPDGVRLPAFVIPTDEEAAIARDTVECLAARPGR
jgi:acetate kinase